MRKSVIILGLILVIQSVVFSNTWIFNDWSSCTMQNCIYNPKKDYVMVYEVVSDEFSGSSLNRNWLFETGIYNGLNRGTVTMGEKVNGWLTLKNLDIGAPIPLTEWFLDIDTAPKIMQIIKPSDNFDVESFITIPSHKPNGLHGCYNGMFYREDLHSGTVNAIDIDYAAHPQSNEIFIHTFQVINGVRNFFSSNYRNYYSFNYPLTVTVEGAFFRMQKINATVNVYFKFNLNDNWTLLKSYNNVNYNNAFIGLYFKETHISNAYANFDYFRITGTSSTGSNGAIFTPIIDLGGTPNGQGILSWEQEIPDPSSYLRFYVQTSPNQINWENWSGPYTNNFGSPIASTNARYIRIKAELFSAAPGLSPYFRNIKIYYPESPPSPPLVVSPDCINNGWANKNNISFTWSGADSNGVTVAGYFYSIDSSLSTSSAFTTTSYINISGCSEGMHIFRIMAQADWGNNSLCSEISTFNFGIDFTPPLLPSVVSSSHPQFTPTNDNNFSIKLSSSDSLSGIAGYSYSLSAYETEPDNIVDNISGNIYIQGLNNGDYIFKAKAIDNAGNTSVILTYYIKVDYKNNILDKNHVKVYPTICGSEIKINYRLNASVKRMKIDIKDASGKTIKSCEGNTSYGDNEIKENISEFANGVYFIKLRAQRNDGKEDIAIKKFIVKK